MVSSLAVAPSGNLVVTAHPDKQLRVWDTRKEGAALVTSKLVSHKKWVSAVAWNAESDHMLVSSDLGGVVKVWDIRATIPLHSLPVHEGKALCVDWCGSNSIASGASGASFCFILFFVD